MTPPVRNRRGQWVLQTHWWQLTHLFLSPPGTQQLVAPQHRETILAVTAPLNLVQLCTPPPQSIKEPQLKTHQEWVRLDHPNKVIVGASPTVKETIQKIMVQNSEGLMDQQQRSLWELLYAHRTAFATSPTDLARTDLLEHQTDTRTAQQCPCRIPLKRNAGAGVIEPSDSP